MGGRGAKSNKSNSGQLPNYKNAIIPKGKIGNYLVNPNNINNQGKAKLFNSIGYNMKNKKRFEKDILDGLKKGKAELEKSDKNSKMYNVEMELGINKKQAKFITAVPKERG